MNSPSLLSLRPCAMSAHAAPSPTWGLNTSFVPPILPGGVRDSLQLNGQKGTPAPPDTGLRWFVNHILNGPHRRQLGKQNPGSFNEHRSRWPGKAALEPEIFDGFLFQLAKSTSENGQSVVHHVITMGSSQAPPNYQFSVDTNDGKVEVHGSMDSSYTLLGRARFALPFLSGAKLGFQGQVSPDRGDASYTLDFEHRGSDYVIDGNYTLGASAGQISYVQNVLSNLAVGAQITHKVNMFTGLQMMARCIVRDGMKVMQDPVSKKNKEVWEQGVLLASYANAPMNHTLSLGYAHKFFSERLGPTVATEFALDLNQWQSQISLGCAYNFLHGQVAASYLFPGVLMSTLAVEITPNLRLQFSANADYGKKDYKFGFGLLGGVYAQ